MIGVEIVTRSDLLGGRVLKSIDHAELLLCVLIRTIVEHLAFGVGVSHVALHGRACCSYLVVSTATLVLATAASLMDANVGISDELFHDSFLFAEVTRSTEHVRAVAGAAGVA